MTFLMEMESPAATVIVIADAVVLFITVAARLPVPGCAVCKRKIKPKRVQAMGKMSIRLPTCSMETKITRGKL